MLQVYSARAELRYALSTGSLLVHDSHLEVFEDLSSTSMTVDGTVASSAKTVRTTRLLLDSSTWSFVGQLTPGANLSLIGSTATSSSDPIETAHLSIDSSSTLQATSTGKCRHTQRARADGERVGRSNRTGSMFPDGLRRCRTTKFH